MIPLQPPPGKGSRMSRFTVDRCRCAGASFADICALARAQGLDWNTLAQATAAGRLCRHCRPWLQQSLAGGPVRFELESTALRNGDVLLQHFCPATLEPSPAGCKEENAAHQHKEAPPE